MKIKDKKIVIRGVVIICLLLFSGQITKWVISINKPSNQITDIEERNKANDTSQTKDYEDPNKNKTLDEWKSINSDVVAKLYFKGKELPVVQTVDNDKYLHVNIKKEKDYYGVPFMDYQNSFEDENYIIYGHSATKDTLVMTSVVDYLKEDDKSVIKLETQDEIIEYVPLAIIQIQDINEDNFMSWYKMDFEEGEMDSYIQEVIDNSNKTYNVNQPVKRLLTLVTCDMNYKNARLILVCVEK